jgi:hypothetical protein
MKQSVMLLRSESCMRDEFDLSASDNSVAPEIQILLSVLSENEMKQQVCYSREPVKLKLNLI